MFVDYKDLSYLRGWYEESKKRKMSSTKGNLLSSQRYKKELKIFLGSQEKGL
jgi:hypothetical protein